MRVPLLILLVLQITAAAFAQGTIEGRVYDKSGGTLPGVKVIVTGTAYENSLVTDAQGAYRVTAMAHGSYSVQAMLAGFCPVRRGNVSVSDGQSTQVNFTLSVAGLAEALWVYVNAPSSWEHADLVAYIRIDRALDSAPWPESECFAIRTAQYRATVLATAKPHQEMGRVGSQFTLLQGHMNAGEPAYGSGQEFVAFLNWQAAPGAFARTGGPGMMLPVRDGRVDVVWDRTSENMTVEELLAKLRSLAKAPDSR